jgi:hypothetical protein
MAGGGEAVGISETDGMGAAQAGRLDADRLAWLVDRDSEGRDRLARGPQPAPVGGGGDQHLGQVDDVEQPGRLLPRPVAEERASGGWCGSFPSRALITTSGSRTSSPLRVFSVEPVGM